MSQEGCLLSLKDSNFNTWNQSHRKALEKAYPVEWFVEQAEQIVSNIPMKHHFGIEKLIKFT